MVLKLQADQNGSLYPSSATSMQAAAGLSYAAHSHHHSPINQSAAAAAAMNPYAASSTLLASQVKLTHTPNLQFLFNFIFFRCLLWIIILCPRPRYHNINNNLNTIHTTTTTPNSNMRWVSPPPQVPQVALLTLQSPKDRLRRPRHPPAPPLMNAYPRDLALAA